jgi:hypothetical protein
LKEGQFRVLEILSGSDDQIVSCQLHYLEIGNKSHLEYAALSYAWGDLSKPRHDIYVNGQRRAVTENCELALRELRRVATEESDVMIIWIDAICIDQDNNNERSSQVLAMRDIYRNATNLVVWLGPKSDDGADRALNFCNGAFYCSRENELVSKAQSVAKYEKWLEDFETQPGYALRMACFASLFARSWFRRVWVVQEYLGAAHKGNEIMFFCGESRTNDAILRRVARDIFRRFDSTHWSASARAFDHALNDVMNSAALGASCFNCMLRHREEFGSSTPFKTGQQFLELVLSSNSSDATDPRDRIYAHLGVATEFSIANYAKPFRSPLATKEQPEMIIISSDIELDRASLLGALRKYVCDFDSTKLLVDYNASIEDVYSSFVRYVISTTRSLNILSIAGGCTENVKRTWTPDLITLSKESIRGILFDELSGVDRVRSYRASGNIRSNVSVQDTPEELLVTGFGWGCIWGEFASLITPKLDSALILQDKHFLKCLFELVYNLGFYSTKNSIRRAYWRMYTHGLDEKKYGKTALYELWCFWLENYNDKGVMDPVLMSFFNEMNRISGQAPEDRHAFVTTNGAIGVATKKIDKGDWVAIVLGCDVPLVLRKVDEHVELVGDCYIDGIMEGEAVQEWEGGNGRPAKLSTYQIL